MNVELLKELTDLANKEDTHISYLLENGLSNLLKDPYFSFNKQDRLKEKVQFLTTCDKDILERSKNLAKLHRLNFTDVIQASVSYINIEEVVKKKGWRHRIER